VNKSKVIGALNKAIALEHAAALQYQQQSMLVRGLWRGVFSDFFNTQSSEAFAHARRFGQKVVALGGIPTVEAAPVYQSTEVEEMLRHALDLEEKALAAYLKALDAAKGDVALCNMLEDQIESEQADVEELQLQLDLVSSGSVEQVVSLRRS
jgi:bacterioferritin (cytochrome b1)